MPWDEAVAVCGVREKRLDGKLFAHVITHLTLALCLFAYDDYREAATKVTGPLELLARGLDAFEQFGEYVATQPFAGLGDRRGIGTGVAAGSPASPGRPPESRRWAPRETRSCAAGNCWGSRGLT
jgi:hypothetical protein